MKDLSEINIEALLKETFTITAIQSEKKAADGTVVTVSISYLFDSIIEFVIFIYRA